MWKSWEHKHTVPENMSHSHSAGLSIPRIWQLELELISWSSLAAPGGWLCHLGASVGYNRNRTIHWLYFISNTSRSSHATEIFLQIVIAGKISIQLNYLQSHTRSVCGDIDSHTQDQTYNWTIDSHTQDQAYKWTIESYTQDQTYKWTNDSHTRSDIQLSHTQDQFVQILTVTHKIGLCRYWYTDGLTGWLFRKDFNSTQDMFMCSLSICKWQIKLKSSATLLD